MYETDLFGDVVVTVDDLKLWLHHVVSMSGSSKSRIEYYIKNNDPVNKIKALKANKTFEQTIEAKRPDPTIDDFDYKQLLNKYVTNDIPACPAYFHRCNDPKCPIYIKNAKHDHHRASYLKRKKAMMKQK